MTLIFSKDDTQKIFWEPSARLVDYLLTRNLRIYSPTTPAILKSRQEKFVDDEKVYTSTSTTHNDEKCQDSYSVLIIETSDLVVRSLLKSAPEDSQCIRAKIVKALDPNQDDLNSNDSLKDFVVTPKDNIIEDIMSYNEILDCMQNQDDLDSID